MEMDFFYFMKRERRCVKRVTERFVDGKGIADDGRYVFGAEGTA